MNWGCSCQSPPIPTHSFVMTMLQMGVIEESHFEVCNSANLSSHSKHSAITEVYQQCVCVYVCN